MPPAIVLVRSQMGENIGAAARAMMNFGMADLRLVAPRDGWPNTKATEMAAHAVGIVEAASVYPTLAEALADRDFALASSARPRTLAIPVHDPEAGAAALRAAGDRSALVFGPERSGLENDDIARCHGVITIPTDAANASLNLAQSVVLLAYACFRQGLLPSDAPPEERASMAEIEGLHRHLIEALEAKDYFHVDAKREGLVRSLRAMLGKAGWSGQEVRTLRGVIRALSEPNRQV